jgi:hypothetical protein
LGADFAALIATRRILKNLSEEHIINIRRLTVMFLLSAFVLLLISAVFMDFAATITYSILGVGPISGETIRAPSIYLQAIMFPVYKTYPALFGGWSMTTIYGVFVWSTLIGLFWIVIFGISLIIANIGMKLEGVGPWLDRNCHVKQRPFQVLAVLVGAPFLASNLIENSPRKRGARRVVHWQAALPRAPSSGGAVRTETASFRNRSINQPGSLHSVLNTAQPPARHDTNLIRR